MERVFRRGLAAFRWGAWIWIAITLGVYWNSSYLRHQWLGALLIALALACTAVATAMVPMGTRLRNRRRGSTLEYTVALAMFLLDGWVRRKGAVFENGPTLGSWWPTVVLVSASTYLPFWGAGIAGGLFGVARFGSVLLNGIEPSELNSGEIISIINAGVFSALLAMSICGLMRLLRNAESELAMARARDEVARTLHDGVLQTLAVVMRRSNDDQLSRLARDQELELRRYLFESTAEAAEQEELGGGIMKAAARYEDIYNGRVNVILAPDLPALDGDKTRAVVGAVGEALTNAGKHGEAKIVTVYVEPDDESGLFCSVKDNGKGFDVASASERVGLSSSIKGRITEVGGRVEIKSVLGDGAEVLMWLP